jgi:hypothetical protein
MRPLAFAPDGVAPPVGAGFHSLTDAYADTIAACGATRSLLRWTRGAEPLSGSTLRVRCVAASSVCR